MCLLKMHAMNLKYAGKTATVIMRQKNLKLCDSERLASWAPPTSFVKKKKKKKQNKKKDVFFSIKRFF